MPWRPYKTIVYVDIAGHPYTHIYLPGSQPKPAYHNRSINMFNNIAFTVILIIGVNLKCMVIHVIIMYRRYALSRYVILLYLQIVMIHLLNCINYLNRQHLIPLSSQTSLIMKSPMQYNKSVFRFRLYF